MAVHVAKDGAVTTVTLDRPDARNAVDPATARELYDAFVAFDGDSDANVAILHGAGGAFCAGFDLKSLGGGKADPWLDELHFGDRDGAAPLGPMGPSRLQLTKPVIAAVAGPAVAGGLELAIWCDLRVMEKSAYMGVYCRRWGVPLLDGGTVRLPRLIGYGRAMDLITTGRRVDADECLRIGLCERVVEDGTALEAARSLAEEIARFPQACMRADRNSMVRQEGLGIRAALQNEFVAGLGALRDEGVAGAGRFAGGKGRHGDRRDI